MGFCPGSLSSGRVHSIFSSSAINITEEEGAGPEVIKPFPCSTQLSTKCILLINVKMPTIDNTTSERRKLRNIFICRYFNVR